MKVWPFQANWRISNEAGFERMESYSLYHIRKWSFLPNSSPELSYHFFSDIKIICNSYNLKFNVLLEIDFRFNGRYVLFHIQCKIWSAGKYMFAWHWIISQVMYWSAQLCMSLVAWLTECVLQNHNPYSICKVCGTQGLKCGLAKFVPRNRTMWDMLQLHILRNVCSLYIFRIS